jgi:hypothetical protein
MFPPKNTLRHTRDHGAINGRGALELSNMLTLSRSASAGAPRECDGSINDRGLLVGTGIQADGRRSIT